MSVLVANVKCMLCKEEFPAKLDEVYVEHMKEHHRASTSIELLFWLAYLDKQDKLENQLKVIVGRKNPDAVEPFQIENAVTVEVDSNELYENVDISEALECFMEVKNETKDKPKRKKSKMKYKIVNGRKLKIMPAKHGVECDCGIQFKSKYEKINHIRTVHKQYFNCDRCRRGIYRKEEDYLNHMATKHPKPKSNVCDVCDMVFKDSNEKYEHKSRTHDSTEYKCQTCDKILIGRLRFKKHSNSHKRKIEKIKCELCGKAIVDMKLHMNTMHLSDNEKKLKCDMCGKGFAYKHSLKEHTMIHTQEKSFLCRFGCGFGSRTPGNRSKHEIKHKMNMEIISSEYAKEV